MGKRSLKKSGMPMSSHRTTARRRVVHIDAHLIHEVTSPQAFGMLQRTRAQGCAKPEKTFATMDHAIPARNVDVRCGCRWRRKCGPCARIAKTGITPWDINGRSRASCMSWGRRWRDAPRHDHRLRRQPHEHHGAFNAGLRHRHERGRARAGDAQCLLQKKPKTMAITVDGELGKGASLPRTSSWRLSPRMVRAAARLRLRVPGSAIRKPSMANRMTICNMSIEGGARRHDRAGRTTFRFVKRAVPMRHQGEAWDRAVAYWKTLVTDGRRLRP